jgi:pimeloyl-ACP methyl ester carboxylesterase
MERAARRRADEELATMIEREGVAAFLKYWEETPLIRSQRSIRPVWRATMQVNRHRQTATGLAASLRQFGQGTCPNLWPQLKNLTLPILLISGAEDLKYTRIAQRMVELLKEGGNQSVEHAILPGCSHMPHLEDPESSSAAVDRFVSRFCQAY